MIRSTRNILPGWAAWGLVALTVMLFFIFSLPHAMALRKLALLAAFMLSIRAAIVALKASGDIVRVSILLILLQLWMLAICVFVADAPAASLDEWKGQWLPSVMAFSIGIGTAYVLAGSELQDHRRSVALLIAVPLVAFLSVNATVLMQEAYMRGYFLTQQTGITDHKANIGYLIALLEPMLVADILYRFSSRNQKRLLPVPAWGSIAILGLMLFSLIVAGARNGIVIMMLAFAIGGWMMQSEIRSAYPGKRLFLPLLFTVVMVLAFAGVSYQTDARWKNFLNTIPVAWDIDRSSGWKNGLDSDMPLLDNGERAESSAYFRIAWTREGWRMLMQHPWGNEISRGVFHKIEVETHGEAYALHSHNSWIDLGLSVGIPGLLLWAAFLFLLARLGWRRWKTQKDPAGVALAMLVIMYAARGLLDSIFRDHMLEQFLLAAGLLYGALCLAQRKEPA